MSPTIARRLSTSHAELIVEDTGADGTPLLLIHGNSSCRGVFARRAAAGFGGKHRLITFDFRATASPERPSIPPAPTHGQGGRAAWWNCWSGWA